VTIGGIRQTVVIDTSKVSAAGDTIAYLDGKLWVEPADTATVFYSDATGIDLNSHPEIAIDGNGTLLLKWHNRDISEDSTVTVERDIVDSVSTVGGSYPRTFTRRTVGKIDSIGPGTYANCLFLSEVDSAKIAANATFSYSLFDNWSYTPAGDSNSNADFAMTVQYIPDDNQVYADNDIPYGAITYDEYVTPSIPSVVDENKSIVDDTISNSMGDIIGDIIQ
jgi:hypothetical protein